MPLLRRSAMLGAVATGLLVLAGCSPSPAAGETDTRPTVVAAFYPLAYAVEQVAGDRVHVVSLTRPGVEPHDLELTPPQVLTTNDAALVVYQSGFQPAVDAAAERVASGQRLDVATLPHLLVEAGAAEGHAPADGHDHSHAGVDPHFWLDPTRYARVVEAIASALASIDPAGATAYQANAATFTADLTTLDHDLATGLATCTSRDLVTGHAAFGYLAARYDLHQIAVAGLSPDLEPTARSLQAVIQDVAAQHLTTVYAEPLTSPALTDAVARETGATVRLLDPVEGITRASAGPDYLAVMRANLATLRAGQDCR